MKKPSPEFDAYIARSAEFAQPILKKIRSLFHKACPDIEETMKWSAPHFEYKGIVAGMAAFKEHIRFGFWKGALLKSVNGKLTIMGKTTMSESRITTLADLPPDQELLTLIREAVALNDQGIKPPARKKSPRAPLPVPDDLRAALAENEMARATFEGLPPSHRREYIEWITEAKQEATRQKRLATTIEWLAEGKSRNWKYERKK